MLACCAVTCRSQHSAGLYKSTVCNSNTTNDASIANSFNYKLHRRPALRYPRHKSTASPGIGYPRSR